MIKVLFVSHSSLLNGAERMLLDTLGEIDRTRFDPLLVIPGPGTLGIEAEKLGVRSDVVPLRWTLSPRRAVWKQPLSWILESRTAARIERLIRAEGVRLVVTNSSASWAGARAARRAGVPHVWMIHEILGGKNPFLVSFLGRRALVRAIDRMSVRIVANSAATAAPFAETGKSVVIANGIRTASFASLDRAAAKRDLDPGGRGPRLGIIGIIAPWKGQMEAVRATAILRKRFPDVRLFIAGDAFRAADLRRLEVEIRRSGLGDRVSRLGLRTDIPAVLAGLDVLIVASSMDSLGRVALEAMAAGTPVVAAAAGGVPEIVINGQTGILVDSWDPESLASGIAAVLEDPRLAAAVVEGGRRFVKAGFTLAGQTRKIEKILEESVGK